MKLPDKDWLERGEVLGAGLGVSADDLLNAVNSKLVRTTTFGGVRKCRRKYWRKDVLKVFGPPSP